MSLTFSETKIFTKQDWDIVVSKYKLVNPPKSQVIMPPSETEYSNMMIYCNQEAWSHFVSNIKSAPVRPFNISLANYLGNVITRYPHSRTSNYGGNLPFDNSNVELFSEMSIDFSKPSDEEQVIMIVPFLKGYSKVDEENRPRLFIADLEAMVKLKSTDEGFTEAVRSKFGKVHLITSSFFEDCSLDTYFGKVTIAEGRGVKREIQVFIENTMGRIISSETSGYSKMISFNPSAQISLVSNLTGVKTTKITARSGGRLHFSGISNEEGYVVVVGQNLKKLEGTEIGLPLISSGINKKLLNNLINLARITSNLPEDIEQKKELMKREIDWVINWVMNIYPFYNMEVIEEESFKVINSLIENLYPTLTTYFSSSSSPSTPVMSGEPKYKKGVGNSCYGAPMLMGRMSSIF